MGEARGNRHRVGVLLIDDDADLRFSTADWLRSEGYHVRTAHNGAQAIELVGRLRPSIMLLDLDMPVMDGREFLAWRRREGGPLAETPVIVMSGHAADEEDATVHEAVNGWLQKPVAVDALVAAIRHLARC